MTIIHGRCSRCGERASSWKPGHWIHMPPAKLQCIPRPPDAHFIPDDDQPEAAP